MGRVHVKREVLTTHDIAELLSVDITTVISWIDQEKIPAFRTPGGHRRVKREDLLAFANTYKFPVHWKAETDRKIVLLVEDDRDYRKVMEGLLTQKWGDVSVHQAEDGFVAGMLVQEFKPDLVVLDLFLPGLNGFKVCERIRADPDLEDTRILAVSGQATQENRSRILRAGADAFLSKPFGIAQFREAVETLMGNGLGRPEGPRPAA